MTLFRSGLVAVLGALIVPLASADDPKLTKAEVARQAKPAVAFVVAKLESRTPRTATTAQGSAFCVHSSGLFVTNAHVVQGATEIELVVNPSQKDQKVYKATVIRSAEKEDLALLRVEAQEALAALSLGDDTTLEELADVVACGYPFGSALTFGAKDYPSITTTAGAISSLRKKEGQLELIQLDVNLNPGNSGGPILDMKGKVIGVALGGIKGTQVNFAIPVRHVAAFLAKPEFAFTAPTARLSDRGKPVAVEARLVSFDPKSADAEVELVVRRGKEPVTRHAMKLEKGAYKVDVVLLPERKGPARCVIEVTFADGTVTATSADHTVKHAGADHKLSAFRTLRPAKGEAALHAGARLMGKMTGLDAVPVTLGGKEVTLDLSTALEVTAQVPNDVPVIVLEVVARRDGKELGRISRSVITDESNKVYLAELTPSATQPGPWPLAVGMHGSTEKNMPIKVNGRAYPKGLGLHASDPPATATYRLGRTANVFQTTVAFNDTNEGQVSKGTHFEVYGDGKPLWKSKLITAWHQTDDCLIEVTGVDVLELRVAGPKPGYGAHAVWLDPILIGPDASVIRRAATKK